MTPMRLEPAALRSRVQHSTIESLCKIIFYPSDKTFFCAQKKCLIETVPLSIHNISFGQKMSKIKFILYNPILSRGLAQRL